MHLAIRVRDMQEKLPSNVHDVHRAFGFMRISGEHRIFACSPMFTTFTFEAVSSFVFRISKAILSTEDTENCDWQLTCPTAKILS
jgi:hypothetical protein